MKKKESSFLMYIDYNNLHGKAMCNKLPVDGFMWIEHLSEINKDFIKTYDDDSDAGYFVEADVEYLKELHIIHSDLPFLPERIEVNGCKKHSLLSIL